jgi:nascent polypeptide-associated complex subunit beta
VRDIEVPPYCAATLTLCNSLTLTDDKKITAVVKKLGATVIPGIEEVNMFRNDSSVLHFANPKVQSAVQSNTFVVSGTGVNRDISELLPGIISQLGPENMENLRALAEQFQQQAAAAKGGATEGNDDDDDDIPDLVENFEETSKEK